MSVIKGNRPDPSRTVVFLDFDGVMNVFGDGDGLDLVHDEVLVQDHGAKFEVNYRKAAVDALRELNCVWVSSWKDFTQDVLNPLFDFDFGYVDWAYRAPSDPGIYGKLDGIKEAAAELGIERYAVVDDSFWCLKDAAFFPPTNLVIAPNAVVGVTDDELGQLAAFVGAVE